MVETQPPGKIISDPRETATKANQIYSAVKRLQSEVNRLQLLDKKIDGDVIPEVQSPDREPHPSLGTVLSTTSGDIHNLSDELSGIISSIEQKLF